MTVDEAAIELNNGFYFDYLHGKVMKIDLSTGELNPWGYDRDNGSGKAEQVITRLRETGLTSEMK